MRLTSLIHNAPGAVPVNDQGFEAETHLGLSVICLVWVNHQDKNFLSNQTSFDLGVQFMSLNFPLLFIWGFVKENVNLLMNDFFIPSVFDLPLFLLCSVCLFVTSVRFIGHCVLKVK